MGKCGLISPAKTSTRLFSQKGIEECLRKNNEIKDYTIKQKFTHYGHPSDLKS